MGYREYYPLVKKYQIPIVITGFEPLDLVQGIWMAVKQLEEGRCEVENQYTRVVREEGNLKAIEVIREVFEVGDREWRGIGMIPNSGYKIKDKYRDFDAETKFGIDHIQVSESPDCIAGQILRGLKKPKDCSQFGKGCTPMNPLGAPMVSSEGACSAYYNYSRSEV
jgi:hydrogenase expression/formation protein HypD